MMETLSAADGHRFDCWMQPAKGTPRGGIVILQEIFGVTDQLKALAKSYAKDGYSVAIPALFDRVERNAVIPFDQGPRGLELMLATPPETALMDIDATVKALHATGVKVGVIGFCWGGGLTLRAAQKLDIDAAVSFYGTRLAQYLDSPLAAPMQGHFGLKDDHTPPEIVNNLKAYLPEIEIFMYDAGHAFANDVRPAYVPKAAKLAHERTKAFLAHHLG